MMVDEPYFMTDSSWFYFDVDKKKYVLTDFATEEAKKSYDEFFKEEKASLIGGER